MADVETVETGASDTGEAITGDKKVETNVPLSALLGERQKFQARESELRTTIESLQSDIAKAKQTVERKVDNAPVDERAKARKEWNEFLGLDKLEERLAKFDAALGKLDDLAARIPAVEHGSNLAFANYARGVEQYVSQQYDAKTMPVTAGAWQKMVAGEMSEKEAANIASGDTETLNKVIERAKKEFTPVNLAGRQREAEHVKHLPRTPGPGGVSPGSGEKAKPFTSLRDLHKQAGEDFASIRERERA